MNKKTLDAVEGVLVRYWGKLGMQSTAREVIKAAEQAAWSADMDAAPRDGTRIIIYIGPALILTARWVEHFADIYTIEGAGWYCDQLDNEVAPTAWRPLPGGHET